MSQPLYKKILIDLKEEILSGRLAAEEQLPTEKELADRYQVSRITSKRALNELEQANLIYRVRGKGSFVKAKDVETTIEEIVPIKHKKVLFLLPFLNDLSVGNFTEGLLPTLQKEQIEVSMATLDVFQQKSVKEMTQEYDGIIYYAEDTDLYLDILVKFSMKNFPVIVLDKKHFELNFPTILSDNVDGGFLATQQLIDEGHQRIAYLFGHTTHPQSVKNRYVGYLKALNKANISFHTSSGDEKATNHDLIEYLEETKVTGIVCENDLVAIEAMRILKQHDYHVPNDYSIIGFDDIQASRFVDPPLTTVAQDFILIGAIAGETLITWLKTKKMPQDIKVPVHLIKRQSTKERI
ncbi:GntR family transcriptional regulator [Enterococcus sp. LJL98]